MPPFSWAPRPGTVDAVCPVRCAMKSRPFPGRFVFDRPARPGTSGGMGLRRSRPTGGVEARWNDRVRCPAWRDLLVQAISLWTSLPIGIGRSARAAAVSSEKSERGGSAVPNVMVDGPWVRYRQKRKVVLPRHRRVGASRVDTARRPNKRQDHFVRVSWSDSFGVW